jgi:hypothetical protein
MQEFADEAAEPEKYFPPAHSVHEDAALMDEKVPEAQNTQVVFEVEPSLVE